VWAGAPGHSTSLVVDLWQSTLEESDKGNIHIALQARHALYLLHIESYHVLHLNNCKCEPNVRENTAWHKKTVATGAYFIAQNHQKTVDI
jgi:hypothetical protein